LHCDDGGFIRIAVAVRFGCERRIIDYGVFERKRQALFGFPDDRFFQGFGLADLKSYGKGRNIFNGDVERNAFATKLPIFWVVSI